VGGAIARARVRVVDSVAGIRDLTLPNAEALERMQPFGTGNPEVRLVIPGCLVDGASTMGEDGRHLQLRLRAGGAHSRALGWGMGERLPRVAIGDRHDVVAQLSVDRWQDLIGPRVTLEAIEALPPTPPPVISQCASRCDLGCPDRVTGIRLRAFIDAPDRLPEPPVAGPLLGVRDRRDQGSVIAALAALAGCDRGVVGVVADASRRRAVLDSVLAPARLGAEVAVLSGDRCDLAAARARIATATDRPALLLVEYDVLPHVEFPRDLHLALIDPPADSHASGWAQAHAAGRWLHLLWSDDEVEFALRSAERSFDLRPVASEIWRALPDHEPVAWGPESDAVLLGTAEPMRAPAVVGRALGALAEIGLIEVGDRGIQRIPSVERRSLDESSRAMACRDRLEEIRAFLERAGTLTFVPSAISFGNARAVG